MSNLLRVFVIALTACVSGTAIAQLPTEEEARLRAIAADVIEVHKLLRRNYRPAGVDGLPWEFPTGDTAFVGDCKAYAAAGYHQLTQRGRAPRLLAVDVSGSGKGDHMIVCVEYWCLDSLRRQVLTVQWVMDNYGLAGWVEWPNMAGAAR
jgi:predicted transglutaminase-like cysteine proteinase